MYGYASVDIDLTARERLFHECPADKANVFLQNIVPFNKCHPGICVLEIFI